MFRNFLFGDSTAKPKVPVPTINVAKEEEERSNKIDEEVLLGVSAMFFWGGVGVEPFSEFKERMDKKYERLLSLMHQVKNENISMIFIKACYTGKSEFMKWCVENKKNYISTEHVYNGLRQLIVNNNYVMARYILENFGFNDIMYRNLLELTHLDHVDIYREIVKHTNVRLPGVSRNI